MASGKTEKDKFEKPDQILISVKNSELTNLSSTRPSVNGNCSHLIAKRSWNGTNDSSITAKETNPFLKEVSTKRSMNFLHTEHEKLPAIDKSLFEVEEPELINIFEKSSLLKNPLLQPCLANPFNDDFVSNPHAVSRKSSTNPFEEVLKDDTHLCTGISEDTKKRKLDSSEWHELDKLFQKALSSNLH